MAVAICVRGLSHGYRTAGGRLAVLDQLDLDVPAGGHVALTGPSGSGKSTLLSVLGGLERPQAGSVVVGEADLGRLAGDALAAYRRSTVGFVFQHFGLLDTLTAAENVELALVLAGMRPAARRARTAGLLADVGLADRAGHRPLELSGGERQRVAIARALANRPQLVLADEPTGNLDEDAALRVTELLESLPAAHGCTLVMVTHNRTLAARAPVQLALAAGRVGPPLLRGGGTAGPVPPASAAASPAGWGEWP
jgi:putative ABC transport system ATP-binding protein